MVLGALSLATTARLTRTSIMENIRADYVRTAKAKGLTNKRVIGVHTLRNSLIPVITFLGVDIGARWPARSSPRPSSTCRASAGW